MLKAHDDGHVPAPADASHTVGDSVGLGGGVVAAAFLGEGAQGNPARLPPHRRRLEAGQESLRRAGPRAGGDKAGDYVLEEEGMAGVLAG